jgi:hypothetical protein
MSILKSTNSGIYQQISEEFLIKNGWENKIIADMEQFGGVTIIKRFTYAPTISNNKKPLSITFNNTNLRKFVFFGEYNGININFCIETIKDLNDLIRYYYKEIDDPQQAYYDLIKNNNVECSLDHYKNKTLNVKYEYSFNNK